MIDMQEMAKQLRLPEGENAKVVTDFMSKGNRLMYDLTFDQFTLFDEAQVLEIGPANGFFVNKLFERSEMVRYTGIDLSYDMIAEAKKNNADLVEKNRVKFIQGDVVSLPFPENTFDFIYTVNTVYFWSDTTKGMSELKRVLKPTGKLVITIRSKETMQKMPFTASGFELFSKNQLMKLFTENGFVNFVISEKTEDVTLPSGEIKELETFCALGEIG